MCVCVLDVLTLYLPMIWLCVCTLVWAGLGGKSYMQDTAEASERKQSREEKKERNRATFGWEAFTAEADNRAYSKRLGECCVSISVNVYEGASM